jgi:tetratricopeptide (TPR) repeat protein
MAELSDVRKRDTVWAERLVGDVDDLLQEQSELLGRLAATLHREILSAEVMATLLQPPPSLQSYSLQIGGVSLMHRSGGRDFERVRDVFEHLIERHPRLAAPRAWLAKWYVLRVTRGIVDDVAAEAAIAMEHTRRALDMDPTCSLALAMQGFVKCHMLRDLDGAMTTFNQALDMNPSDSLAWLFKGVVHSFWGEGEPALAAVVEALRLSPLDPLRHYYDGLAAPAALAAGRYELAVEFAERSLRVNRLHSPTLRALAIAQSELGQMEAARATVKQLLVLEPGLSERSYLQRSPAGANETRVAYARALRRAGVPAG